MKVDVFTLFPDAFAWFLEQVHVQRARELGVEFRLCNYRDYTPLRHGQVDDTPYGGGAGMVLRIDVVCAALEAVYGVDCTQVKAEQARRRADAPRASARRRARRRVGPGRPVPPLRALRGYRRARARAGERPRVDRAVRSLRRRDRRRGPPRRGRAQDRGRRIQPGERELRLVRTRPGGSAGTPALHAAGGVPRLACAGVLLSGDHAEIERWRRGNLGGQPPDHRSPTADRASASREQPVRVDVRRIAASTSLVRVSSPWWSAVCVEAVPVGYLVAPDEAA